MQPGQGWDQIRVPVRLFLLEHPQRGRVLVDTGFAPPLAALAPLYCKLLQVRWGQPQQGIDQVILTHLHPDHIAGCCHYPQAQFLYSRQGLETSQRRPWRYAFLSQLLPPDWAPRSQALEDQAQVKLPSWLWPFELGRDLWGDGSLWAIDLPGHAPGQFGLAGHCQRGPFFLLADACFSRWEIEQQRTPSFWLMTLSGAQSKAYRATLARLGQLLGHNPQVELLSCHEVLAPPPAADPAR